MSALISSRRNALDFSHICLTVKTTVLSSTQVVILKSLAPPRGLFYSPSAGYIVSGFRLAGNATGNATGDAAGNAAANPASDAAGGGIMSSTNSTSESNLIPRIPWNSSSASFNRLAADSTILAY